MTSQRTKFVVIQNVFLSVFFFNYIYNGHTYMVFLINCNTLIPPHRLNRREWDIHKGDQGYRILEWNGSGNDRRNEIFLADGKKGGGLIVIIRGLLLFNSTIRLPNIAGRIWHNRGARKGISGDNFQVVWIHIYYNQHLSLLNLLQHLTFIFFSFKHSFWLILFTDIICKGEMIIILNLNRLFSET